MQRRQKKEKKKREEQEAGKSKVNEKVSEIKVCVCVWRSVISAYVVKYIKYTS